MIIAIKAVRICPKNISHSSDSFTSSQAQGLSGYLQQAAPACSAFKMLCSCSKQLGENISPNYLAIHCLRVSALMFLVLVVVAVVGRVAAIVAVHVSVCVVIVVVFTCLHCHVYCCRTRTVTCRGCRGSPKP